MTKHNCRIVSACAGGECQGNEDAGASMPRGGAGGNAVRLVGRTGRERAGDVRRECVSAL